MATSATLSTTNSGSAPAIPPAQPVPLVHPQAHRVPTPLPLQQQAVDPTAAFARMSLFSEEDKKNVAEDLQDLLGREDSPFHEIFSDDEDPQPVVSGFIPAVPPRLPSVPLPDAPDLFSPRPVRRAEPSDDPVNALEAVEEEDEADVPEADPESQTEK